MGRCMKCGNYMPWDTGLCTACKEAEAKANARRYEQDKKSECPSSYLIILEQKILIQQKWQEIQNERKLF